MICLNSYKGLYERCRVSKLYPEHLYRNSKTGEWEDQEDIYTIMLSYFEPHFFKKFIRYDPATKDESDFWNDTYISTNCNFFIGVPDYFKDHFLCYTIHELYEHNDWAFQDIAKINNIEINTIIKYNGNI